MELTLAAVRGKRLPKLPELRTALVDAEVPEKDAERIATDLRKEVDAAGGSEALSHLESAALEAIRKARESRRKT